LALASALHALIFSYWACCLGLGSFFVALAAKAPDTIKTTAAIDTTNTLILLLLFILSSFKVNSRSAANN